MEKTIDKGTRIKDNDPRNAEKRGIGTVIGFKSRERVEVEWSGSGRTTVLKIARIDNSKHGYSVVE